ncbi:hypothetical protein [Amphritea sp.]|uniref:hypothetical protein n=1 Tax=Amphritea sp. TaxID=1872502 RepID=UPI003A8FF146
MKALITSIALATTLAAGAASATNFNVGQLGDSVNTQGASRHHAMGEVVKTTNLPGSSYSSDLFVGNK